jgi:hypothetical protein
VAGRAIKNIQKRQIQAEARIAETAIAIAETKIGITMVARAVPIITGLTQVLTAATNAADQAISMQEASCVASTIIGREATRAEVTKISQQHHLPDDETAALVSFVDANAANDITRLRARAQQVKETNEILYERALSGIKAAKLPGETSN